VEINGTTVYVDICTIFSKSFSIGRMLHLKPHLQMHLSLNIKLLSGFKAIPGHGKKG